MFFFINFFLCILECFCRILIVVSCCRSGQAIALLSVYFIKINTPNFSPRLLCSNTQDRLVRDTLQSWIATPLMIHFINLSLAPL